MLSNKLITANFGEDTLSIVNLMDSSDTKELDLVKLGYVNHNLTINKMGPASLFHSEDSELLVLNSFNNSLMKVDLENQSLIDIVNLGRCPIDMEVYLDKIYIINCDSNSIYIVDDKNFRTLEIMAVGDRPVSLAIDRLSNKIYVANLASKTISIIDDNDYMEYIEFSWSPLKIQIWNEYIYILFLKDAVKSYSKLLVLDLKKLNKVWEVELKGLFFDFIQDYDKKKYYLVNAEDSFLYSVDIYNKATKRLLYLGGLPFKIVSDGIKLIYISDILKNEILKVNILTNQIENRIKVGKDPQGILLL